MKLSTQIFLGFLIAISIDLLDSFVNYTLTLRVKKVSDFLSRSEAVIRNSSDLDKSMVQMQSAFRGFLLTGDEHFLAPYDQGLIDIPTRGRQMRESISLQDQLPLVDSILALHNGWVNYANGLVAARKNVPGGIPAKKKFQRLVDTQLKKGVGQEYNDRIARLFHKLNEAEYKQRNLRRAELSEAIRRTDRYSLIFSIALVLIGVAIALYLVRKISHRIGSLVKLAGRISRGDFGQVEDDKQDELSSLSVSLNLMSEKLSRNIGELEKKNIELNQFAYVVSHDLKAPVRGISNVVLWIEEDLSAEISPTMRQYLDFIVKRISRMQELIDGLLEYARAGGDGTARQRIDVEALIAELADMVVPEGYIVNIGRLPVLYTERAPFQQVFGNLIGNVVKHTPPGSIVISVEAVEHDSYFEFSVEDNGPGIDPLYHEKIFGLFQTLREKNDTESTGIGLSIVRKVVEDRGGHIRVISSPGRGAKFIFTWPKNR